MATSPCLWFLFLLSVLGPSHAGHFTYTNTGQLYPCILLDTKFSIRIDAVRYKRVIESFLINSEDQTINITGRCGKSTAILNLGFGGAVTWTFIFRTNNNFVTLDRLIQFIPKKIFAPYVTELSDPCSYDDPKTYDLSLTNQSSVCNTKTTTFYIPIKRIPGDTSFNITAKIYHLKVQAFGVTKGRYSPYVLCHRDIANASTPIPTTTPTTPTTPTTETTDIVPTVAPDNLYVVTNSSNNVTCVALTGRIEVGLRYQYNTSGGGVTRKFVSIPIPSNATATGNCYLSNVTQNIVIKFFQPVWSLEFIFKRKSKSGQYKFLAHKQNQDKLDYKIENITLTYIIDQDILPGSALPPGSKVRERSTIEQYPHKSLGKDFFSCSATIGLEINRNTELTTSDFKFKAFNTNKDQAFPGSSSKCSADETDKEKRAVIIVGSVIGSILVLVVFIAIIAVLCKRKRQRRYRPIR